jgi:hypothetical protein
MLATQFDGFEKGLTYGTSHLILLIDMQALYSMSRSIQFSEQVSSTPMVSSPFFSPGRSNNLSSDPLGEMWKSVSSSMVSVLQSNLILAPRFHRAMTRPFFSKDRISHFDIFDRHASNALHQLKARLREGYPVNIQVRPFGLLSVLCRD